jgi:hypothetical protein
VQLGFGDVPERASPGTRGRLLSKAEAAGREAFNPLRFRGTCGDPSDVVLPNKGKEPSYVLVDSDDDEGPSGERSPHSCPAPGNLLFPLCDHQPALLCA